MKQSIDALLSDLRQNGINLWLEEGRLHYKIRKGASAEAQLERVRQYKAEIINFLQQTRRSAAEALPLSARQKQGRIPLSFAQERLWVLDQLEALGSAYNIPVAMRLRGALNVGSLERSLAEIVRRHEALRTRFPVTDGFPAQVIESTNFPQLEHLDLTGIAESEREGEVRKRIVGLASRDFNLASGPLFGAHLLKLAEADHVFVLVLHHIISDGWSRGVLVRELNELYAAHCQERASNLPQLSLQYADYAVWQREQLTAEVIESHLAYWRSKLAGAPRALELPTKAPRPRRQTFEGAAVTVSVPSTVADALKNLSDREGATLYMVLLAAFQLLLSCWSNSEDVVVGTPIAGRTRREIEGLIGFFVNMLPMRSSISDDLSFRAFLKQVRETALEAFSHQEFPFEKLIEGVRPERDLSRQPLFQMLFALQNLPYGSTRLPGLEASWIGSEILTSKFDLSLYLHETAAGLWGYFEYSTGLFERQTIEWMVEEFNRLLGAIVANFDVKIGALRQGVQPTGLELALSSTFVSDPVLEPLWLWAQASGLTMKLTSTGYNQVLQSMMAEPSLTNKENQFHVILLRLEDWGKRIAKSGDQGVSTDVQDVERNIQTFVAHLQQLSPSGKGTTLVAICPGSPDLMAIPGYRTRWKLIEQRVQSAILGLPQVHLLPLTDTLAAYQVSEIHDGHLDRIAHVPYRQTYFTVLAASIMRQIFQLKRRPYKVIVVDCDNTLWRGICGEDGPLNVRVTAGCRLLQEYLLELAASGVLLCLCSRNNESDVAAVFSQNRDMVLSLDDITAHRIGWTSKPEAIAELAEELNLGLDSFVFLDDDPAECARMVAARPEVLTIPVPLQDEDCGQFLSHLWMFDGAKVTDEDRRRSQMYRDESRRQEIKRQSVSLRDFISSLELNVHLHRVSKSDVDRAVQLAERCTQFNTTGIHLSPTDVSPQAGSDLFRCYLAEISDRFGDYGQSGLLVLDCATTTWRLSCFALSCRVLGRDVEFEILDKLTADAREGGATHLQIDFQPSARNLPAQRFLREIYALCNLPQDPVPANVFELDGLSLALKSRWAQAQTDVEVDEARVPHQRADAAPSAETVRTGTDFQRVQSAFYRAAAVELRSLAAVVDWRAVPTKRQSARSEFVPPRTKTEEELCRIFAEVLRVESVGIGDNFFELGGHSLAATRVIARVRDKFDVELPLRTLFEAPTVLELSQKVATDAEDGTDYRVADLKARIEAMSPDEVRAMLTELRAQRS
jgi:FkbH-like protein